MLDCWSVKKFFIHLPVAHFNQFIERFFSYNLIYPFYQLLEIHNTDYQYYKYFYVPFVILTFLHKFVQINRSFFFANPF